MLTQISVEDTLAICLFFSCLLHCPRNSKNASYPPVVFLKCQNVFNSIRDSVIIYFTPNTFNVSKEN